MARWVARTGAAVSGLAIALALATAAYAHVEVEISPAVAGAHNAMITFDAEAESPTAGIAKVQVFLPTNLAPSGITLSRAPAGWTLTPGTDNYTVAGPALAKGVNAVHSITVAQLPDTTKLVFKVLVTYADGSVDRWIEEPSPANPDPDHPAPVAQLSPGPSAAPTTAAGPTAPVTTAPVRVTPTVGPAGRNGGPWWWLLAALVGLVAAGVAVLARRRRGAGGPA